FGSNVPSLNSSQNKQAFGSTMRVSSVSELFVESGSASFAATLAVLLIFPAAVGVTSICTLELAETAMLPIAQVTVPDASLQPGLAETNVTVAGSVSVTVTPVASSGPLLVT